MSVTFPFGISADQETNAYYEWLQVAHNPDGTLRGGIGAGGGYLIATFSHPGNAEVGPGVGRFPFPLGATLMGVIASADTAPTGAALIFDVNRNGSTIFTTQANRPTIGAGGHTSSVVYPDVTTMLIGEYLSVDIDQIGSTITGADITVQVVYVIGTTTPGPAGIATSALVHSRVQGVIHVSNSLLDSGIYGADDYGSGSY